MGTIEKTTLIESDFLEQAFHFWLNDQQHIRSPFPNYIHNDLKTQSVEAFTKWLNDLHPDSKDEFNDEMIAEKFEEILFETAMPLIKTEDERLTILFPFLPRLNDKIANELQQECNIIERNMLVDGDNKSLEVKCINLVTNEKWSTSFELPN